MRFRQFVHINLQITWTARLHNRLTGSDNHRSIRYEDMVSNPELEIKQICDFLDIDFVPEMLEPKRFGSSYDKHGKISRGIVKGSLDRWRTSISPSAAKIIDVVHNRAIRTFGYDA